MKKIFLALAFSLAVLPVASLAQMSPGVLPSTEVRAQLEQARNTSKTEAMNALSADHRAKVQAILSQLENGSLSRKDAQTKIDNLLTPQESQAVLAAGQKMADAMHAAFSNAGPSQGGSHQGGPPQGAQPQGPGKLDAGMVLVLLNSSVPSGPPTAP